MEMSETQERKASMKAQKSQTRKVVGGASAAAATSVKSKKTGRDKTQAQLKLARKLNSTTLQGMTPAPTDVNFLQADIKKKLDEEKKKLSDSAMELEGEVDNIMAEKTEQITADLRSKEENQKRYVAAFQEYFTTLAADQVLAERLQMTGNNASLFNDIKKLVTWFAWYTGPNAYDINLFFDAQGGNQWTPAQWENLTNTVSVIGALITFLRTYGNDGLTGVQKEQYSQYIGRLDQIAEAIQNVLRLYDAKLTQFTPDEDVVSQQDITDENKHQAYVDGARLLKENSSPYFLSSSSVSNKQKELEKLYNSRLTKVQDFLRLLKSQLQSDDRKVSQYYTNLLLLAHKIGYGPIAYRFESEFFAKWVEAQRQIYLTPKGAVTEADNALNFTTMQYACYIAARRLLASGKRQATMSQNVQFFTQAVELFSPDIKLNGKNAKKRTPYLSLILDIANDIEVKARTMFPYDVDDQTSLAAFKQILVDDNSRFTTIAESLLRDITGFVESIFDGKTSLAKSVTRLSSQLQIRLRFV